MMATTATLQSLIGKMNSASGQASVDAIAELLTTMVNEHVSMHQKMVDMVPMMQMMKEMRCRKTLRV